MFIYIVLRNNSCIEAQVIVCSLSGGIWTILLFLLFVLFWSLLQGIRINTLLYEEIISYKYHDVLFFCREDLRRWFIQQEMDLFKFRFNLLPKEKVQEFLKFNDLEYVPVSNSRMFAYTNNISL